MTEPSNEPTPTETGKARWPPTGIYEGYPCTCTPACEVVCRGQCGCKACDASYQDFLSMPEGDE